MFVPLCVIDPTRRDASGLIIRAHDPGSEVHTPAAGTAWEDFQNLFEPVMHRLIRRHRLQIEPEDAAQEAWLELYSRFDRYRKAPDSGGGLPAWAWIVALRRLRRMAASPAYRSLPKFEQGEASMLVDRRGGPPEALEVSEARQAVRMALVEIRGELADVSHAALVLLWVDGLSMSEAAMTLGVTPASLRNRLRRALPIIRASLSAHDFRRNAPDVRSSSNSHPGEVIS